jgi:signal transduction histidine kinase/CheY-like chemotaxis protein
MEQFLKNYADGEIDNPIKPENFEGYLTPPKPKFDRQRKKTLWYYYRINKSPPKGLRYVTEMLADKFNMSVAIALIDDTFNVVAAKNFELKEKTLREESMCGHTILRTDKMFVVPDASVDWRFEKSPIALKHKVKFYAGSPLVTKTKGLVNNNNHDQAIGALCILDDKPHTFTKDDEVFMNLLSNLATELIIEEINKLRLKDMDNMSECLMHFSDLTGTINEKIKQSINKCFDHIEIVICKKTIKDTVVIDNQIIPLYNELWESDDYTRMAIVIPVYSDIEDINSVTNYIVVYTNNERQIFEQMHIDFVKNLSRLYTIYIQKELIDLANNAKTIFIKSLSHELRTPLHGIIATSELLLEEDINDNVKSMMEIIMSSGKNLTNIINGIIDFNKYENRKFKVSTELVNILDIQTDATEALTLTLGDSTILLVNNEIAIKNCYMHLDPALFKQLLLNILDNAVKFTPHGSVILTMNVNNSRLYCKIQDTGEGISEEFKSKLFKPFHKEKPLSRGIGLGLNISKQIIDAMQGTITINSTKDNGTTVLFDIPVTINYNNIQRINYENIHKWIVSFDMITEIEKQCLLKTFAQCNIHNSDLSTLRVIDYTEYNDHNLDDSYTIILCSPEQGPFASDTISKKTNATICTRPVTITKLINTLIYLDKKRDKVEIENKTIENIKDKKLQVLIVDDNSVNRNILSLFCKKRNMTYYSANDGLVAFEQYKKYPNFDIVFMDIQMPKCDGPQSVKYIRQYEKSQNIKSTFVVMMTGLSDDESKEDCLNSGANDYYIKPISIKVVDLIINSYLANRH